MKKVECFKIRVYSTKEFDITSPCQGEVIYEVKCGSKRLTGHPVDIVADPYLFVHEDTLYLFYEAKRFREKGVIAMVKTKDLKNWSEPIVVLKESFHLSYPYVFEDNGHVYMMPETCADHSIILYEATDLSCSHFEFKKKLISRLEARHEIVCDFSDSSVIQKDEKYYLHTTVNYSGLNTLELYVSDNLDGEYVKHQCSPIVASQKYGRNAGCLMYLDGHIYRVAQDCVKRYGDNVHLLEVNSLTHDSYSESVVMENIFDTNDSYYRHGGHQLNVVKFNNQYIVATDAKEYHYFIDSKFMCKLRNLLHI